MLRLKHAILNFSIAFCLLFSDAALASTSYTAIPMPQASQAVSYENGAAIIQSNLANSNLAIKFLQYDARKMLFLVTYKNGLDTPMEFGIDQFIVHDADGVPLKLYTRDELIRSIKQKRATKKFFAILGGTVGVLAAISASQQTRTGRDSTGRFYSERYTDNGILAVGTALSVGASAAILSGSNKNSKEKIEYLNENYLAKQTVQAGGGETLGIIEIQLPKLKGGKNSIDITVNASGDTHILKFDVEKN